METLVTCPCGHVLALHDYEGCTGDRLRGCRCERNRYLALEAAVDSVRSGGIFATGASAARSDAA
jgi:hypothetical protein